MEARILIVDDDKDIRKVFQDLLESCGYHCVGIADPLTALHEIQNQQFDLVLTDYQMPMMDGIQFLKSLSLQLDTPAMPVIMITGIVDDTLKARALHAGAVAFFTKPLNFGGLLEVIKQIILKNQRLQEAPCPCGKMN